MKSKIFILLFLALGTLHASVLFPSSAYELALENNNAIKSSTLQLEATKEGLNQWISKYYPQINATIDYNNFDYELNEYSLSADKDRAETSLPIKIERKPLLIIRYHYNKV